MEVTECRGVPSFRHGIGRDPDRIVIGSDGNTIRVITMAHSINSTNPVINELDHLATTEPPWVCKATCELEALDSALKLWVEANPGARVVRLDGTLMKGGEAFYDELIRAIPLPDYFGRNLNALSECITDVDVLAGDPIVFVIRDGQCILSAEGPGALAGFLDTLRDAGTEWATPVQQGEAWDRPRVAFHVIIQIADGAPAALSALPDL